MCEELREKIADAELVLVGIGEEFTIKTEEMEKNLLYGQALSRCRENEEKLSYIKKHFVDRSGDEAVVLRENAYRCLAEILKGKNYFVVTLCTDGLIREAGLDENRITEPCGNMRKMQCTDKCTAELYDREEEVLALADAVLSGEAEKKEGGMPVCPICGKKLVFNNIAAENYAEEGYMDSWQTYRKWLQGTVNRKTCILELGVGLQFPTVIRWPFEKVVYFNRKAFLFRVHSRLYQTTEEIKERSMGIQALPTAFLK